MEIEPGHDDTRLPEAPPNARRHSVWCGALAPKSGGFPSVAIGVDIWMEGGRWRAQTEHRCAVVESDLHAVALLLAAAAYFGWVDRVRLLQVVAWRERAPEEEG